MGGMNSIMHKKYNIMSKMYVKNVLTKLYECAIMYIDVRRKAKKEEYGRVHLVMPKSLLDRLDSYCDSVMKGKPRIRSVVIRNLIEEFLDKQKEN